MTAWRNDIDDLLDLAHKHRVQAAHSLEKHNDTRALAYATLAVAVTAEAQILVDRLHHRVVANRG